jgi:hypothetical protein
MKQFFIIVFVLFFCNSLYAQQPNRPALVAGFPVNYNEDSVGIYSLPPLLVCNDGTTVTTSKQWINKRRPELLKLVETIQYGKMPAVPATLQYDVFDKGTPAFSGKAIRKQVTIYLSGDTATHKMNLLIYLPANARKKAPLLLNISFSAPNQIAADSGVLMGNLWTKEGQRIKADKPLPNGKMNIEQFIDAGFGFATVYYGDIEPDFKQGIQHGIRGYYLKPGQTTVAANEWGAISAWAWGLSRAMDYFEKDKQIDSKRIALQGASRLGKTVLWAGIHDERFKLVIASISGEGGAAIARRNYGETIQHITDTSRYYYQFAPAYHSYANNVQALPFDAHALVALMAPRPLLLQTGSTDYWSDPKGELLAATAAAPVYNLFGKTAPATAVMPAAGSTALLLNDVGYYMHDGGHTVLPEDWKLFITYLQKYL